MKYQYDVYVIPDQRIDDIKYWEKEVDDKLDGIKTETDNLLTFRTRIEKAIESCKEPLHIAQQCLINRSVHTVWWTHFKEKIIYTLISDETFYTQSQ